MISAIRIVFGLAFIAAALVSAPAAEPVKITLLTDWKAQAEHGGFYQALAKGFYAARGLDVTIRSGSAGVNPPQQIAAGVVDFAVGSNSFQPLNLAAAGADVQAVAAIFQKDPQVILTHPRSDITRIADIKGKPIMVSDATIASWWHWAVAKYGFTDSQIRKYTFSQAPFVTNPLAIQQGYVSSEPYLIEKEGRIKPKVFLLADDGYPGYANLIMARGKDIRERPEIVRAFVAASIEGWRSYLYEDNAPANALIKADNPEMTDDLIAFGVRVMKERGIVDGGDAQTLGIGAMTEKRWADFFEVMVAQKVYEPAMFHKKAYSTQFLPKEPVRAPKPAAP